jgi:orotate phosphoribosyltransferase
MAPTSNSGESSDRASDVVSAWLDGGREGAPVLTDVAVATRPGRSRDDLVSPYDARYAPLRPTELAPIVKRLVASTEHRLVDVVLAISESGIPAAYEFAAQSGLPLVIATEVVAELPQAILLRADHDLAARQPRSRRIYPLSSGDRVIIVEHHTITGRSVCDCVGALRSEGIECSEVATVLAADDPGMRSRLSEADIELHAARLVPGSITGLLVRDAAPAR